MLLNHKTENDLREEQGKTNLVTFHVETSCVTRNGTQKLAVSFLKIEKKNLKI